MRILPAQTRQRGGALVITLSIVVLATITILALFSQSLSALRSSHSTVVQAQTDSLVQSAVDATISDLRMEMLAGAETVSTGSDYTTLAPLVVLRNWAMVPARVVSSNVPSSGFENLVKQSLSGAAFYPGASPSATFKANGPAAATGNSRASSVNTRTASAEGRVLSAARWDQVALTSGTLPSNALPDWIYVTRSGVPTSGSALNSSSASSVSLSNTNYVIGRYAYQIYDVGGLLDANAAGAPAGLSADAQLKGSLAWADLTAIGLSKDQIASLMSFRHPATGSDPDFADFIRYQSERNGFLKPLKSATASDNFFYSRQDLIRFFLHLWGRTSLSACTASERSTLASLTQDLRFSTAPSWNPDPNRARIKKGIADYPNSAEGGNNSYGLDDLFNPTITSSTGMVQANQTFTRARFDNLPSLTSTHEVSTTTGEPALLSRFPLDRLRLITRDAVADKNSLIYRYFGLTRASKNDPWIYNHGTTSNPVRILRLSEVLSGQYTDNGKAREPDFLEVLRMGIIAGSLGKSGGVSNGGSTPMALRDERVNYQVIQIFANLVDQFDEDSYPTHIQFDGEDFYGVEDLPYLVRVKFFMARLLADTSDSATLMADGQPYSMVFLPEVWNPHDPNVSGTGAKPTKFRVAADTSGNSFQMRYRDSQNNTSTYFNGGMVGFDPTVNYIELTQTAIDASREPVMINSTTLGTPSIALKDIPRSPPSKRAVFPDWQTWAPVNSTLAGIASPAVLVDFSDPKNKKNPSNPNGIAKIGLQYFTSDAPVGLKFVMEYQDSDGTWRRYFTRTLNRAGAEGGTDAARGQSGSATYYNQQNNARILSFDPRTDRFSTYRLRERDQTASAYVDGTSIRSGTGAGYGMEYDPTDSDRQSPGRDSSMGWTMGAASTTTRSTDLNGTAIQGLAMATILQNATTSATHYTDPDGELRSGDGILAEGSSDKEGQMYWPGNYASRPIILNRPFRSVAEMGYAFRDTPCRSLDFFTAKSGDATLLDFFCINEVPDDGVTSGRVSANTRNPLVLQSLLQGALKDPALTDTLDSARALEAAQKLVALTTGGGDNKGPLLNRSEIATRLLGNTTLFPPATFDKGERIKRQREVFARALGDAVETRTWNLLIDLVVQKGNVRRSTLTNFQIEAERHVWVHLAIDRYSGKVLHTNYETITE